MKPASSFRDEFGNGLDAGCEASFIALEGNPLIDPKSLGRIGYRVKDGKPIETPERPT